MSKPAFGRTSRYRTEVSRRPAGRRPGDSAKMPADRPSPSIHLREQEPVRLLELKPPSRDRVSRFERLPELESRARRWPGRQSGAYSEFPRGVQTGGLRRREKAEKLRGPGKLTALGDCIGQHLLG